MIVIALTGVFVPWGIFLWIDYGIIFLILHSVTIGKKLWPDIQSGGLNSVVAISVILLPYLELGLLFWYLSKLGP